MSWSYHTYYLGTCSTLFASCNILYWNTFRGSDDTVSTQAVLKCRVADDAERQQQQTLKNALCVYSRVVLYKFDREPRILDALGYVGKW